MAADYSGKAPSALVAVLRRRCPRCATGSLFEGFLKVAPRCTHCGLDLRKADPGDGPAVLVMFLLGPLAVSVTMVVEFHFAPPIWQQLALFTAITLIGAWLLLPLCKSLLIVLQYRTRSGDSDANRLEE